MQRSTAILGSNPRRTIRVPEVPTSREIQKTLDSIVTRHRSTDRERVVMPGRIQRKRHKSLAMIGVIFTLLILTLVSTHHVPAIGNEQSTFTATDLTPATSLMRYEPTIAMNKIAPMLSTTTLTEVIEEEPVEEEVVEESTIINLPISRERDATPDIATLKTQGQLIECNLPDVYYPGIDFSSFQPFMCFTSVTNRDSSSWKVLNDPERAYTDELGFRRSEVTDDQFSLNGEADYAIALGNYYKERGSAGDRFLIVTSTGMYTAIVGDEQDDGDTDAMNMFQYANGTARLIEWIVDMRTGSGFPRSILRDGTVTGGPIEVQQGEILHIFEINPAYSIEPLEIMEADNFVKAWNFLIDQGFTPAAAAGVLGNLKAETRTLNPDSINYGDGSDGSNSIGIIQWNSGRAKQLKAFASERGEEWNNLETQLAFLIYEMPLNDSFFNSKSSMRNAKGKGVISALTNGAEEYKTMTSPEQAARIFDAAYVRSPGNSNQRAAWAQEFYSMFTQ